MAFEFFTSLITSYQHFVDFSSFVRFRVDGSFGLNNFKMIIFVQILNKVSRRIGEEKFDTFFMLIVTRFFKTELLVSIEAAFIISGETCRLRNGIIGRVEIDKGILACTFQGFCKVSTKYSYTSFVKVVAHSPQSVFIDNVRIL
ncbi:Hypothetical protein DEACI_0954 [Acididesulfobacillus acetoxydans]|uniref:Uncharacterized protein n=1 Tax=Acididesulfobacillus acetoxydans TaxID=1561005 RepID=A0A8S0WEN3_9FIRM|nr:Hypothetical protein DEACI_0954 [Acididesulfobacillus acetoxydans]CEJ06078.1 Hypothetical protein DEACI_0524 [Acididesulfobacillus acetoxydans]